MQLIEKQRVLQYSLYWFDEYWAEIKYSTLLSHDLQAGGEEFLDVLVFLVLEGKTKNMLIYHKLLELYFLGK